MKTPTQPNNSISYQEGLDNHPQHPAINVEFYVRPAFTILNQMRDINSNAATMKRYKSELERVQQEIKKKILDSKNDDMLKQPDIRAALATPHDIYDKMQQIANIDLYQITPHLNEITQIYEEYTRSPQPVNNLNNLPFHLESLIIAIEQTSEELGIHLSDIRFQNLGLNQRCIEALKARKSVADLVSDMAQSLGNIVLFSQKKSRDIDDKIRSDEHQQRKEALDKVAKMIEKQYKSTVTDGRPKPKPTNPTNANINNNEKQI